MLNLKIPEWDGKKQPTKQTNKNEPSTFFYCLNDNILPNYECCLKIVSFATVVNFYEKGLSLSYSQL